jgi:hypothetical protein
MNFRYRDHLIFPVAYSDPAIGDWTASVHIEFTEQFKIHTVVLRFGDVFQTEREARRFMIKQAKQWVDGRRRSAPEPAIKAIPKHCSSPLSGTKQAMYWICRPCKNNRHDLCLKISTTRIGTNVKIRCWCSLHPRHESHLHGKSPAQMVKPRRVR